MDQLCKPKNFELQPHQQFLKSISMKNKRILLYHGLGSGKTCSAISLAKAFMKVSSKKILVITPASLKPNFYKEVIGPCGREQFKELRNVSMNVNRKNVPCKVTNTTQTYYIVDELFHVMSYQQFVKIAHTFDYSNTMVIVDEVQNIISATGNMYKTFFNQFVTSKTNNNDKMSLVLLSGTPIFDNTYELALLGNLLRNRNERVPQLPTNPQMFYKKFIVYDDGRISNEEELIRFFKDKVSHYRGANPIAYPTKREHLVKCQMSPFQLKVYNSTVGDISLEESYNDSMSQCFLIGPRQTSNVVYPNGRIDVNTALQYHKSGFSSKKHSCKFHECLNRVQKADGTVFVYSNFVRSCGINTFAHFLESELNYVQVTPDICPTKSNNKKINRYAIFKTGNPKENTRILQIFNSYENRNGDLIKVILGSPAMKEGVTLLRVSQVHLLDPYWNRSRIDQVIGRAVRFCSHKDVPMSKRVVDVYHYYAVTGDSNKVTVDLHIHNMSIRKQHQIQAFERVLKESAFDCVRFKRFNEPPMIQCNTTNKNQSQTPTKNDNVVVDKPTNNTNQLIRNTKNNNTMNKKSNKLSVLLNEPQKKSKKTKLLMLGGVRKLYIQNNVVSKKPRSKCPKPRRPSPLCPSTHPYKGVNKHGNSCCYKRPQRGNRQQIKPCIQRFTKDELKKMAIQAKLYSSGPITKRVLCQLLKI